MPTGLRWCSRVFSEKHTSSNSFLGSGGVETDGRSAWDGLLEIKTCQHVNNCQSINNKNKVTTWDKDELPSSSCPMYHREPPLFLVSMSLLMLSHFHPSQGNFHSLSKQSWCLMLFLLLLKHERVFPIDMWHVSWCGSARLLTAEWTCNYPIGS